MPILSVDMCRKVLYSVYMLTNGQAMYMKMNNKDASALHVSLVSDDDGDTEIRYNGIAVAFISSNTQFGLKIYYMTKTHVSNLVGMVTFKDEKGYECFDWVKILHGEL